MESMANRRFAGLVAVAAVIFAACSSTAGTAAPAASTGGGGSSAAAGACTVGVSWNNFQQPRWAAHDKPNIQKTVEAGGGTYIDADANLVAEQQLTDIDTLISDRKSTRLNSSHTVISYAVFCLKKKK